MKTCYPAFLLLLVSSLLSSCLSNKVEGSGNTISDVRQHTGFENVKIKGVISTNISYAEDYSVVVHTDEVAISKVLTSVADNTLVVDLKRNENYENITFEVDVTLPKILRIEHSGVSNSKLTGFNDLDTLEVVLEGVGDLTLEGSANHLSVEHEGVGKLKAFGFKVKSCDVDFDGVGNTEVFVSDQLNGQLSGVGNIRYKGNPKVSIDDSGVGNVVDAN